MSDVGQIKAKREAAAKARRLSSQFSAHEDRSRVLQYAAELDAQADTLERELAVQCAPGHADPKPAGESPQGQNES